jgi:hypothetical protein
LLLLLLLLLLLHAYVPVSHSRICPLLHLADSGCIEGCWQRWQPFWLCSCRHAHQTPSATAAAVSLL